MWALISRMGAALATSKRRSLPSEQPVASTGAAGGAVGLKAAAFTVAGWAKFFVGAGDATFHVRTALSPAVYRVWLSAAKVTSNAPPADVKLWITVPKSGGG